MSDERFNTAAVQLQQYYGRIDTGTYRSGWEGTLRFLLERMLNAKKFQRAWPELKDSWLNSPLSVAQAPRADLFELLEPYGVSAANVALLHRLARWWHAQEESGATPFSTSPVTLESQWEELSTQDRVWITRLFCVVGGLNRFPVTRAVWRVACRHKWQSWHDDPSETPALFESGNGDRRYDQAEFAEWMIRVGEDFCGPKPKCATCPLQSLLDPDGPCDPDD